MSTAQQFTESGTSPTRRRQPALAETLTLTPAETLQIHRSRYPDGLVCDQCGKLIATVGYAGRVYQCAGCTIEAPALAKAEAARLAALRARPVLPAAKDMTVWAKGDGKHRAESLALMGVPPEQEAAPVCLVNGQHSLPEMASECPILSSLTPWNSRPRSARKRRAPRIGFSPRQGIKKHKPEALARMRDRAARINGQRRNGAA